MFLTIISMGVAKVTGYISFLRVVFLHMITIHLAQIYYAGHPCMGKMTTSMKEIPLGTNILSL